MENIPLLESEWFAFKFFCFCLSYIARVIDGADSTLDSMERVPVSEKNRPLQEIKLTRVRNLIHLPRHHQLLLTQNTDHNPRKSHRRCRAKNLIIHYALFDPCNNMISSFHQSHQLLLYFFLLPRSFQTLLTPQLTHNIPCLAEINLLQ